MHPGTATEDVARVKEQDDPAIAIPDGLIFACRYLDLPSLLSWMSARQYAPEGGYSGRTNKLVDGCYSHWVGAAWTFIEAGLRQPAEAGGYTPGSVDDGLYSKEGLIRYVLSCCQAEAGGGGLRDKPNT